MEEAAERAVGRGWIERVTNVPYAFETHGFDPEGMNVVFQGMLDEAEVRTFCQVFSGDPIVEEGRVRGVTVDTREGRQAFLTKIVIDANRTPSGMGSG